MTKKSSFTLIEIMIVVAVIGLLAVIAIPSFIKARNESNRTRVLILRMINSGKEQSAMELKLIIGEIVPTTSVDAY